MINHLHHNENKKAGNELPALLFSGLLLVLSLISEAQPGLVRYMKKINGGSYQSFFVRTNNQPATVPAFYMSTYAVTNAGYLAFVKANPQWRKSKANKLFVDANYLRHWKSDLELNAGVDPNSPVVYVSWFAANAYSRWKGERLPTTAEWEWAGAGRFVWPKDLTSQSIEKAVLAWYEKPSLKVLPPVGAVNKNAYGLYDMHGLVWEWVSDFNSFIGSFDSRGNAGATNNLFCAAGSLNAADKEAYATYLRYSYRGSLKGRYCIANLGFRTARSLKP